MSRRISGTAKRVIKGHRISRSLNNQMQIAYRNWSYFIGGNGSLEGEDERQKLRELLDGTMAAHGYNDILEILQMSTVLAIARMTDGIGRTRATLPHLAAILRDKSALQLLNKVRERSARRLSIDDYYIDSIIEKRLALIEPFINEVGSFVADPSVKALREFRDIYLAHSLLDKPELRLKVGEIPILLNRSAELVDQASTIFRGTGLLPEEMRTLYDGPARHFWRMLQKGLEKD